MTTIRMRLEDPPTAIRPTAPDDAAAQLALRRANREHTGPWDPARDESFYTEAGQRLELDLDQRSWAAGSAYAFAVLDTDLADRLIGRVALSNVVRGPWQNATLGYWIDKDALGRGHATRAVRLVLRFAFEHAGLHRVQPAIIPRNARSVRVAEKAGFRLEGRALRYLKINGTWEDHDVYALTRRGLGGDGEAVRGADGGTPKAIRRRRRPPPAGGRLVSPYDVGVPFPQTRLRRLRATPVLRDLVRETRLDPGDFVLPLFVEEGLDGRAPIDAMPGVDRLSIAGAVAEAGEAHALGIPAVLLFGIPAAQGRGGLGRLGRRGRRPARHARDQGRPPRRARHRRPVPVRVHEPRPLRPAARRRRGRQRRERRAAGADRAVAGRTPAPT